jgi:hypothetical protein
LPVIVNLPVAAVRARRLIPALGAHPSGAINVLQMSANFN